jgi:hypothetical protein
MDNETLIFALKISGSVIGVLVTILISITAYLGKLVLNLKDTITELKTINVERYRSCDNRHAIIDKRLDAHSAKLNELEKNLLRLS